MRVGMKTQQVQARLSASQLERLKRYAEYYKMSISDILREAVTVWLNVNMPEKEEK